MGNKGPLKALNGTKLILDDHGNNLDSFRINLISFRASRGPLFHKPFSWLGPFFAVSYSKPALVSTYLVTLLTYILIGSWKGRLILWADQLNTFFLSLKSYISSLFPLLVLSVLPSQQVFDDESYLRRQNCNFLFLSSVCTGGRKAISKLMFPNSGCQFQWKTNLFLEKLGMVEATWKSLKKKIIFWWCCNNCLRYIDWGLVWIFIVIWQRLF